MASCSTQDCTSDAIPSLAIEVLDPAGQPVCDATGTISDEDFSVVMERSTQDCTYFGPSERPGTYQLSAVSGGLTGSLDDVRVSSDECHVRTERVAIQLADA
jgi:hypothetical protein